MIAVDTNLVVRLLAADEPKQTAAARRLFEKETVFLSRTVLLESFWVLRATYGLPTTTVLDSIAGLLGLDGAVVESREAVAEALDLARSGMDFADALHVVASPPGVEFATFDRALRNIARRARCRVPVVLP
jgi:predicted nucleic-acid-binding protein